MTFAESADHYLPALEIIGPYSEWPRRRRRNGGRRVAVGVASVAAAGVFVHCTVPLLF